MFLETKGGWIVFILKEEGGRRGGGGVFLFLREGGTRGGEGGVFLFLRGKEGERGGVWNAFVLEGEGGRRGGGVFLFLRGKEGEGGSRVFLILWGKEEKGKVIIVERIKSIRYYCSLGSGRVRTGSRRNCKPPGGVVYAFWGDYVENSLLICPRHVHSVP